uniref:Uncharacterized protein n=1 Tax=Parascaris equorum TaxID=6256 RepID=A0A914R317_PAREQ
MRCQFKCVPNRWPSSCFSCLDAPNVAKSGNLILGGGRIRAHPSDPRKTIVDYVLCADLKGLDVSGEKADQTLIKFMIEDIESAKDQIEKIKVRAKKQSQGDEEEHLF